MTYSRDQSGAPDVTRRCLLSAVKLKLCTMEEPRARSEMTLRPFLEPARRTASERALSSLNQSTTVMVGGELS